MLRCIAVFPRRTSDFERLVRHQHRDDVEIIRQVELHVLSLLQVKRIACAEADRFATVDSDLAAAPDDLGEVVARHRHASRPRFAKARCQPLAILGMIEDSLAAAKFRKRLVRRSIDVKVRDNILHAHSRSL
jgi:hypothetical protein